MIRAHELTGQLLTSRHQLVETREDERRRIRRDLHDGLGPTLAAVRMTADAAGALVATDPVAAQQLLHGLGRDVETAMGDVRRLVHSLRPPVLDQFGLMSAVRQQAERLTHGGCRFEIVAPDRLPALSAAVEVAAYRILTEAMTNVARHAHASRCTVRVDVDGHLSLAVEDDGTGVPEPCSPGVGLASIRERASELGGRTWVERIDPHGTRLAAVLPLGATS
jgi:two-component system NarL family sensor kinase